MTEPIPLPSGTIEFVNKLTGAQFFKYLIQREIKCPCCGLSRWTIYVDGKSDVENRIQIQGGVLIRQLDEGRVLDVAESMPPPSFAATCISCGHIASFNALIVAQNILEEVDAHG